MKKINLISIPVIGFIWLILTSCELPAPENKHVIPVKNNYIILVDLSDRIIVQPDQIERDKEIIRHIYTLFEKNVRRNLYIKSRDEIKVVIAPQRGSGLRTEIFEDRLFINMEKINRVIRRSREEERKDAFIANLDTLYRKAVFSDDPEDYFGADIWRYFYEDLRYDYVDDTLTDNYLFILTDGYPIVGRNPSKLQPVNARFPGLHIIMIEAAPREMDLEWDRIIEQWSHWFEEIQIPEYILIKRQAITKEKELIGDILRRNSTGISVAQISE